MTRSFQLLKALRRPRGPLLRGLAAGLAGLSVLVISARWPLAHEAGRLWWRGDLVTGLHRLRWYIHHGWPGMFLKRCPDFDPTTGMDTRDVAALDRYLTGRGDTRARLAHLAVLARLAQDSDNPAEQSLFMDRYAALAQKLTPRIAPPDVTARPAKGQNFSLSQAEAALASLDRHLSARWFILSGTFLGAVREGGFLSHDYDIDIGIHAADFDAGQLAADLAAAPDLVHVTDSPAGELVAHKGRFQMQHWPALISVMHDSGLMIDIFIHHIEEGDCWHGSAKHRWSNTPFDLAPIPLAGLTVQGPADADRYLTENYGDWRTPKTDFDCSTGTPNVRFHRNLSAITAFLRTAITQPGTADAAVAVLVLQQEGYLSADRDQFTLPWQPDTLEGRPDA